MTSEGVSWGEGEHGDAGDIHTEHSEQQVDNSDPDPHDSGEEVESGAEEEEVDDDEELEEADEDGEEDGDEDVDGDGGDYDPESVTIDTTPQVPDTSASTPSQRPASKPKMSGGFIMEVSDDEDDDRQTPQSGAVALHEEPSAQSAEINGATASHQVPSPVVSAPLGIDPLMMLEARIKEDPRGDMDAWLNLIADYKRRGRLDDARSVYNRFFEMFPNAVCAFESNPRVMIANRF